MLQPRHFHFLASFALMVFLVCFQSVVLARASSHWLQIDLVSIFVIYVSIEHYLLSALVKVVAAGILMQTFSAIPAGFYVMYFLLALVLSGFMSRRLVLYNRLSQFLSFAGIFLLKFVFLYFTFVSKEQIGFFGDYFLLVFPSFLATVIVAVPVFRLLSAFDELFAFHPLKDRPHELNL